MSFTIDEVLEIIQIVKECKDTELHIDTGDIKLSLTKGEVSGGTGSPMEFSGPVCIRKAPESEAPPATPTPAPPVPEEVPEAAVAPAAEEAPAAAEDASAEEIDEEGLVPVVANVTSVFYRKPSPEEPPFVEVGDAVEADSVVCLLEVMKCFRQVTAEVKGVIEKICVESNNLVEQGTALFLIRPE